MDLRKYIYSHCVEPQTIKTWNSYLQCFEYRQVPCGCCLHCTNTYVNEWCTRLVAQKTYSKYCYYVSLDYAPFKVSDPVSMQLAVETAACYNDLNKTKHYGLHPLILCKNHLQDFFKRLRKNTGVRCQYFSCGEYGMHANGRGYGRPHFHNIIFSNVPISEQDFINAWSIKGYVIGRVDFKDMSLVGNNNSDNLKIFRYVCKYLQKKSFSFDCLATIDYHRTYFKSLLVAENKAAIDDKAMECKWREYIKQHSPFVVCSRRPAIGSAYLAKNLERFKAQDFRLFGLQGVGLIFPRYYVRRAKESLIDFRCIGEKSKMPCSSSSLGTLVSVLSFLYSSRLSLENWCEKPKYNWCTCVQRFDTKTAKLGDKVLVLNDDFNNAIPLYKLSFYDDKNKYMYQFNGFNYNVWAKTKGMYSLLYQLDILDVLKEISPQWSKYSSQWLKPMYERRVLNEKEFVDSIQSEFPANSFYDSYFAFKNAAYAIYKTELDTMYKTKMLMSNSKQTL